MVCKTLIPINSLYFLLILVLLPSRIKCDISVMKEQRENTEKPLEENNSTETPNATVITTAITEAVEKSDDNKLGKVVVEYLVIPRNKSGSTEVSRVVRDAAHKNRTGPLECLSCTANGLKATDSNSCYKGTTSSRIRCRDAEHCFTELHPLYIKRGCMLQNRLNRTFFCKCPLCNNKPANDFTYYEYASLDEWQYDNFLLQKPMDGVDLMCKVCETMGTSRDSDDNCRSGRNADYTICGGNQVCYINIDEEIDHVSRGCAIRPVYNTMFYFCDEKRCNNETFPTPKAVNPNFKFSLKARVLSPPKSKGNKIGALKIALLIIAWKFYFLLRSLLKTF